MNGIDQEKYERVLYAVEHGCSDALSIKERFGTNGVYILKKLVKLGCVLKVKGNLYKKISDLPFTKL